MPPGEIRSESVPDAKEIVDADWTSASALLWQTAKHPCLQTNNSDNDILISLEENENTAGIK